MSGTQLAVMGIAAVLVFWMVGAHNRLIGLRNAIGVAWAHIEEQLKRRREALPLLVDALRDALPAEHHTFEAVLAAQQQLQAAVDAVRVRPVQTVATASLATAEGVLASALTRLLSLLDQHPALREEAQLDGWMRELHDADLRLAFARQAFNDAVDAYNRAARQFPTGIVAGIFGLGPGGRF